MNYFTKAKPYNSLNEYYKHKYHQKVSKIALDADFTCPNKDGRKGYGGCTFCQNGSTSFIIDKYSRLEKQFNDTVEVIKKKWPNTLYIPYLQANSNTYGDLESLKKLYEKCLSLSDNIVGLDISTRADCITEEICEYLGELNKKIDITVELGIETSNEKTSERLNRCLTNDEIINAVKLLRKYNIEVVAHIINGLPGEDLNDMLNTIRFINNLDIQGIKFHTLLILENTKLKKEYESEHFHILTLDEYVDIVVKQIALLNDKIIIHRLSADAKLSDIIEPKWAYRKLVVMNEIDKKMRALNIHQGDDFTSSH